MTAPTGYIITGYRLTARSNTSSVPYTLTPSAGGNAVVSSTDGVQLETSGLKAQTASFTYSAASDNSFYIPSLVITVVAPESPVNVTYNLYESDGTTWVNSVVAVQEANSAVYVPSSLAGYTYYDYETSGTIGESDCVITVKRTLKSGVVISNSNLSNEKCYNITTNGRGAWVVPDEATAVTSTTNAGLAFSASDTKQQFAFILYEGNYYLYSVSQSKFISKSGNYTTLTEEPDDNVTLLTSNGSFSYPVVVALQNGSYHAGISNGYNPAVITHYNSLSDNGNRAYITEADDFDPTAALAELDNYFHPSYTVTYKVQDEGGNILFTSDPVGTTLGANITTLPAEYQITAFYNYNNIDLTVSDANTTAVFTATLKDDAPVKFTTDATNPYYYNLNIRSQYLVYDAGATGEVTLQTSSEPFNANASWAFIGEPYAGFKVINKTKGTGSYLTYTSIVTGGNSGNNNIQFVAAGDFTNQYWNIDTNTGGFCLRMKENPSIYFHHDYTYKFLRTCSVSEWSTVHNDAGSTIIASTDEDVLFALYDSMKDWLFGTSIGQMNTTDAAVVTNEVATSTVSSVGTAISAAQTADYPSAYEALVKVRDNVALVTPDAGFYRLKNVATDKYLNATAVSGYLNTNKYVFANGDNTSAATVIRLQEGEGGIYMYNQGYGFGWVDASKSAGAGLGYLTSIADKYVNWFPGKAANQIAFAICLGNGTGDYASYLTKGIYTADTGDESVVGGTDYTANAAQWVVEEATSATVNLNSDGAATPTYYATFCAPFSYTVSGATAYTLAESGDYLVPTPVDGKVAAGTPVLLKGTASTATLTIVGTDYAETPGTNGLTGTYLAKTINGTTDYVLGINAGVVGFYHWDSSNLSANRAYLASTTSVKGFAINWDGETDGISAVDNGQSAKGETIYTLSGQRVSKPTRGLYIVNGKKVVIK